MHFEPISVLIKRHLFEQWRVTLFNKFVDESFYMLVRSLGKFCTQFALMNETKVSNCQVILFRLFFFLLFVMYSWRGCPSKKNRDMIKTIGDKGENNIQSPGIEPTMFVCDNVDASFPVRILFSKTFFHSTWY